MVWKKTDKYDIADWPSWNGHPKCLMAYRAYVAGKLESVYLCSWSATVRKHTSSVSYCDLECGPGASMQLLRGLHLSSATHMGLRGWCRLRCGLLELAHLHGKRSAAIHRDCIWCGCTTRKTLIHCLSLCSRWAQRLTWRLWAPRSEACRAPVLILVLLISGRDPLAANEACRGAAGGG